MRIVQTVVGTVVNIAVVSRPEEVFQALGTLTKLGPDLSLAELGASNRTWVATALRDRFRASLTFPVSIDDDTSSVDML